MSGQTTRARRRAGATLLAALGSIAALAAVAAAVQDGDTRPGPTTRPAGPGEPAAPAKTPQEPRRPAQPNPAAPGFDAEGSDARAIELADAVMARMGGRAAWDATRHVAWSFFGVNDHVWDKHTGNVRIEGRTRAGQRSLVLMNIHSGEGRAWLDGEPVTDPDHLAAMLEQGRRSWINDSYWLVMPYKLKDTGVTLKHLGERAMGDGRPADVLELTFREVGVTPQNKYHVYVARDSGLVEQWDFFADRGDEEPRFTTVWHGWKRYGDIWLSGDRGELRGRPARLEGIAVYDELPGSVYTSPQPWEPPRDD